MDDPSLADLTRTDNPALQGYRFAGTESPVAATYRETLAKWIAAGHDPSREAIGPGGKNAQGLPYAWQPYDPLQSTSGVGSTHTKWGPTVDDPIFGKLQATYTEPEKARKARERAFMALYGTAIGAITAGAASPLLGSAFSAATKYGTTGSIDPKALALSAALSLVPGALGGIDPALAQIYSVGSKGIGIVNTANQARRGNYDPALNAAAGIGLKQLTGALG